MASSNTSIEWADRTWNPLRGCRVVTTGCDNCYAQRIAYRFSGEGKAFEGLARKVNGKIRWTGKVRLLWDAIYEPLTWRKPSRVFVNSMSDLFHEDVPDEFLDEVFQVMSASEHIFQILTKRPARMLEFVKGWYPRTRSNPGRIEPNIWLGVSVENQAAADERIPLLLQTPAAIHFLSCEPLLDYVDIHGPMLKIPCGYYCDEVVGHVDHPQISWVICGGESGPGARPMYPQWARRLRDDCRVMKIPFFFKQWGEWLPYEPYTQAPFWTTQNGQFRDGHTFLPDFNDAALKNWIEGSSEEQVIFERVGKKASGRLLDGRTWDEMPAILEAATR